MALFSFKRNKPLIARYTIHSHANPITPTQKPEASSRTEAKASALLSVNSKR